MHVAKKITSTETNLRAEHCFLLQPLIIGTLTKQSQASRGLGDRRVSALPGIILIDLLQITVPRDELTPDVFFVWLVSRAWRVDCTFHVANAYSVMLFS